MNNIAFNKFYKQFGIFSVVINSSIIIFTYFKRFKFGVDFKGGTLIEIRIVNSKIILFQKVRDVFNNSNLNNLTVKNFGDDNDYLIKFQKQNLNNPEFVK